MPHPLDALRAAEIAQVSAACKAHAKHLGLAPLKFLSVSLKEPSRYAVAKYEKTKKPLARLALAIFAEQGTSGPIEAVVQLGDAKAALQSWTKVEDAIMPLVPEDFKTKGDAIRADPEVQRLCAKYDIDMCEVEVGIWPVFRTGPDDLEVSTSHQQAQGFLYWCPQDNSNIYAYPLPWVPILDCETDRVTSIYSAHAEDELPEQCTAAADYASNLFCGKYRTDIKPLDIVQPEGPSFTVEGNVLRWQKWEMRVRFDPREGMILHDISFDHGGLAPRPILHRASMPEMTVPYAETQAPFHRRMAFDAGDCGFGFCANSLQLGCDCVGAISYLDGIVNDVNGQPVLKEKVICIHEEDAGMLWKHTEMRTMSCETRRARKLVLSSIATLGNYEYSLNWYFQDATIQYEVKLTGIVATNLASPADGNDPLYGTLMLPRVVAGYHQHVFCARLDFAVDNAESGQGLIVTEVDCVLEPPEKNSHGGAFRAVETKLTSEMAARRLVDPMKARIWKVSNPQHLHPITGKPVAFKIVPAASQPLLAREGSSVARAGFGAYHLWVTQNDEARRWPGGTYPLQNLDPGGLYRWVEEDRTITDPVMWHVFGTTHIPRPEDFPIMPVDTVGFTIKPVGFFASNPTLDVPPHINRMSKLHPCCPGMHTPRVSDANSAADLDRARRRSSSNRVFTTSHRPAVRMSEPGLVHELTSIPERSESDLTATLKRMWDTMQHVAK